MLDNVRNLDELLARRAQTEQEIVDNFEAQAREVRDAQRRDDQAHERAQRNARVAEAGRRRRYLDLSQEREHEAGQLAEVLSADEPPVQTVQPATPPSARDGDTAPLPGGIRFDDQRPQATPPADVPAPVRPRSNHNPRHWRGLAWLLAVVGAFVGLIVARATAYPMWSDVHEDEWHALFVVLWYLALVAAGFFSGGWAGASIEESREASTTR